jgi:NAD-dependent SIR2 family protein deacetylase
MELSETFRRAAEAVRHARRLVITAGAGMGVDSGLPDFRGDQGFWKAYPMYERLGWTFVDAANPDHFARDPAFGWGFYGHRTNLYRETTPHAGFALLLAWIARLHLEYFVVTSNVDGQFQKAGFAVDRLLEVHGSIHHLQCTIPCSRNIWENREAIPLNHDTMRARQIPRCIHCGAVARPNILMFGDYGWLSERTAQQELRFARFQEEGRGEPLVVIELGAGTAIPTIRYLSERLAGGGDVRVIRINPRDPQIEPRHLGIPCGALAGLSGIEKALSRQ